ncbi:MAG TPA: hypothetical protein VJ695_07345 [Nitrososphaera sp.]|nr:hypothetical protein [Nitrososphaera sp.]
MKLNYRFPIIIIKLANPVDAEAILDLQKSAFVSEAKIYDDYIIPSLTQTLDEIKNDFRKQTFLKATDDDSDNDNSNNSVRK